MAQLETMMREHFVDYASYFILDRAIPDLRDGLKPVQRRILHTLFRMHDGRYHKVANVIGEAMKLHPHGDSSIGDALVVLANKGFFIDRQGNFGNLLTGHPAAAAPAGAVEDHVRHLPPAQRSGGLLAEHPLDGVDDVALAAAVRPNDATDAVIKVEFRPVGEALEARQN